MEQKEAGLDGGMAQKMEGWGRKQRRAALIAAVTAGVYLSFRFLLPFFLPFLTAYLIALLLRPSASCLSRKLRLPLCVVGGLELLLVLVLLITGLFLGGRCLLLEANRLFEAIPLWVSQFDRFLTGLCRGLEVFCRLPGGVLVRMVREMLKGLSAALRTTLMPGLMMNSAALCGFVIKAAVLTVILLMASIFSLQEMEELRRRRDRSLFRREFALIAARLTLTGNAWLKTQAIICFLTTCLCILTLTLMGNTYAILIGISIGLLDALPLFGAGVLLIPWGLLLLFQKQFGFGLLLLGLYLVCYLLRQLLEARLMGKRMGLSPLETLAAIYVGIKLFGLLGVLLGPIGLMLIEDLVEEYDGE